MIFTVFVNVSVNQLCKRSRLFLADDNLNHVPPPLTGCGQLFDGCQNALLALIGQFISHPSDEGKFRNANLFRYLILTKVAFSDCCPDVSICFAVYP